MHNTTRDVALTYISRETNYSMILCSITSSSPFLSLSIFLECS